MNPLLPRVTPTGWGEEAYQAKVARRRTTDDAGLPLARAAYRPTDSGILLNVIARAFAAWEAAFVGGERRQAMTAQIEAFLEARFPTADMVVLDRHGLAHRAAQIGVSFDSVVYQKTERFDLTSVRLLPDNVNVLKAQLGPVLVQREPTAAHLPDEMLPYFRDIVAARTAYRIDFSEAITWVSSSKARDKRYPYWREIEAQFPLIGAWLASERAAGAKGQHHA